jgi:hypothetical protein
MGQKSATFNKWNKSFVAGFVEKKDKEFIPGSYRPKLQRHGVLHWESAVANFIDTYDQCKPLAKFDNSERTNHQGVDMFFKMVTNEIREQRVRKKTKKRSATNDRMEHPVQKGKLNH